MSKICQYCGKELPTEKRHNKFCDIKCATDFKKEEKIKEWKEGSFSGTGKNGQISKYVRNYLLEKNNYKCELCGWGEKNPTTNLVPLEVHHIDGNYLNNEESNLQVLCPNCHSLTSNFKSLNKNSDRKRTQVRKNYCVDCGAEISSNSIRCHDCESKNRITEKPVTREELKDLIRVIPFTQIADQFNVTDNAIRKWCIRYGLPSKKKDIKNYSDEEWAAL